jgi:hypothetical protein
MVKKRSKTVKSHLKRAKRVKSRLMKNLPARQAAMLARGDPAPVRPAVHGSEKVYSVAEVADMLRLSPQHTVRMFQAEPVVMKIRKAAGKRVTLRIPWSVYQRVRNSITNP